MPLEEKLEEIKKGIGRELEVFFDRKVKEGKSKNKPEEYFDMVEDVKEFVLSSGKRIRPILFCCGYQVAGGKNEEEIIKASLAAELIHSYLLIHDDIIDQDNFRHGGQSMHYKYENNGKNLYGCKNAKHFGASMAIIVGDLASTFGYEILANSDFHCDLRFKALDKLNEIIADTVVGEGLDVVLEERKEVSAADITQMQEYKTAKYTIEGPLHLGAILAGADEKLLRDLSEFAIPLGIAFQIRDDIIGVYGDEKKTGKPVGADIREGKKTLLVAEAMEKSSAEEKNILCRALGNSEIAIEEINRVRQIITKTGSLNYSQQRADELKESSLKKLEGMQIADEYKEMMKSLADFMVKREY